MQSLFMRARASLENKGAFAAGAVPEMIADSWHRCLRHGLDPLGEPTDAVLSYGELRERLEKHERLLSIVRPELELLSKQIAGTNYLTAFADREGIVLDVIMDNEFKESDCSRSINLGSIWSEEMRGTNALGLALHAGKTAMVTGGEHFFSKHVGVSCVSTPIFDSKGEIVGLLDASSEVAARQFHTQALVSLAALNIENRLFVDEHRKDIILQFHPREEYLSTQSVGMISIDQHGNLTGINRRAADILNGIETHGKKSFEQVFQNRFSAALKPLMQGDVIRLVDWLNSSYFARLRITRPHPRGTISRQSVSLSVPAVFSLKASTGRPVVRDEQVADCFRLALRSAKVGAPLAIIGDAGTGKTTFAQTVHTEINPAKPLIVLDCSMIKFESDGEGLIAEVLGATEKTNFNINSGGTLFLENLAKIDTAAAEKLAHVVNRLLQSKTKSNWLIISTGTAKFVCDKDWLPTVKMSLSGLSQVSLQLPNLLERTDFSQIAQAMLDKMSEDYRLSTGAIEALKRMPYDQNLNDLDNRLKILMVQCPGGIIREEQVLRHLVQSQNKETACPKCIGNTAREAKCNEINRVFRQCNSNVALASRKLGVSRNTVYSHVTT